VKTGYGGDAAIVVVIVIEEPGGEVRVVGVKNGEHWRGENAQ
jgi:hypothetical protein